MLLVDHVGVKSGKRRTSALGYLADGDDYVVVASKGGSPRHPAWYLNLRDDPEVTIQVLGDVMPARARTAEGEERERLWRTMAGIFPPYDQYQERAGRRIPVVVLEPQTG
jgi:deazaflavin-dependent oxidoreductase (nitroreductase family)